MIEAVKEELVSDVPISIFLSGGIDSSIIAALAVEQSKYNVETFTIGFEDKTLDETKFSNEIAKKIGTNHKLINFDSEDFKDLSSRAFENLDIPLYINYTPKGVYKFNLYIVKPIWEIQYHNKTTQFKNNSKIPKEVAMLDIKDAEII